MRPPEVSQQKPLKNDGKGRLLLSFWYGIFSGANCETSGGLGKDRSLIIRKIRGAGALMTRQAPHTWNAKCPIF